MENTIEQLKALAYDILVNIEFLQGKLRETNNQISELQIKVKKEVREEVKK